MLLIFDSFEKMDTDGLMEVYEEACRINAVIFYPHIDDAREALKMAWEDYLRFIHEKFFIRPDDRYFVLTEKERYISAVRSVKKSDGSCFLEALETAPRFRNKGFGEKLLYEVSQYYFKEGVPFIKDKVLKTNTASLKCHEKCGFEIENESEGRYYDLILKPNK